jgi:hypothetical protein
MSHFMKTSGPAGLAKPRGSGAPCRRRSSALQDRDEDVRHRSHSCSQRDGRTPIATARRPFLPVRASASHVACQRGQSKCVVKFAITQLITNKPVTPTGYLRFPVAAGLFGSNVEHAKRLWFTRDHLAMAQALGWDRVASFYIDLEAPVPPSGIPKPGPLQMLGLTITCDMRLSGFRWQACC